MNTGASLNPEDFRKAHNALCDLRGISDKLKGVLHPDLAERLERTVGAFEEAFAEAYKEEDRFSKSHQDLCDAVRAVKGFTAIWSITEVEDFQAPHPYAGRTILGYETVRTAIRGGTWLDLYAAADEAIRLSGDEHHVFIENFRPDAADPSLLRLATGS